MRTDKKKEETMDVAIVVGIAFAGFVFSCLRSWGKLKEADEIAQPRMKVKERTFTDHHAAA
jgi:hypothetical protein